MNKQQTAVQWQFDELQRAEKDYKNEVIDGLLYTKRKYEILEQAKEMDKKQKKTLFECGRQYQLTGEGTFTQVYQELYGTE